MISVLNLIRCPFLSTSHNKDKQIGHATRALSTIESIKKDLNTRILQLSQKKSFHPALSPFVNEANKLLLSPDAKRIRGIFPVLIGKVLNLDYEAALLKGIILELLHFTSLIHDDFIDDHRQRRGFPTLNSTFARNHAVLIGDFMMCEVINHSLSGKYGNKVIELLVEAVQKLVTGVIMEQDVLCRQPTLENYIEMVAHKTGSLFRLSLGLPFVSDKRFLKAASCGESFGLLFQIYDDYLDHDSDKSYENIFHIASPDQIQALLDKTYGNLLAASQDIGIDSAVLDMVAYLQSQGYFTDINDL
jgi:geranylgeranyl pyrophosphate synthase